MSESNYEKLFGTPERAARTLLDACDNCGQNDCSGCQVYELTSGGEFDGPLMCKVCGELADMEFGDMCAECYWHEGEGNDE